MNASPVVKPRNRNELTLRHLQLLAHLARAGYPVVPKRIGGIWCSRVIDCRYRLKAGPAW